MSVIRNDDDPLVAGYWGDMDATIDWCEGNYEQVEYIAEFWYVSALFLSCVVMALLSPTQAAGGELGVDASLERGCVMGERRAGGATGIQTAMACFVNEAVQKHEIIPASNPTLFPYLLQLLEWWCSIIQRVLGAQCETQPSLLVIHKNEECNA
jgi:hypothetical protein